MRHVLQLIEGAPGPALPVLATANDIREVVQFLKKRPEGITVVEASDSLRKRLFDPRKVSAYELWGVVSKSGDRIRLSELGREFAARLAPEAGCYRAMLDNTPPYRAALEWIHEQGLDLVTHADVSDYWQCRFPEALRQEGEISEGQVVSFLHLCHAAEIGTATVGRKSQPSRLRVERDELAAYIRGDHRPDHERAAAAPPAARRPLSPTPAPTPVARVFISARQGAGIAAGIREALQIADIDSEVVERCDDGGELMPALTVQAMRRCDAGIIIVGRADAVGKSALSRSALVEIGAAFVHFAGRLILLYEKQAPLPFNLGAFCHYELDGDGLTWETGLRLVKSIKHFRAD